MIEILNIYFLSTCLLVIFSFPFSNRYASNIIKIKKINIFEIYLLNTIFTTSILLILSFFRIDLTILFFVILICSLINLFFIEYGKFKKDLILFFFFFLFIVIFFTKIANYPVSEIPDELLEEEGGMDDIGKPLEEKPAEDDDDDGF